MATEFSAFEAPTLPAPDADGPAALPPPPIDASNAPTLPGLPELPPPTTPTTPPPTTGLDSLAAFSPPSEPPSTDPKKRSFPTGLVVALFAAAVVGIAAYLVLTGGSSDDANQPASTEPVPETQPEEPSTAIGQTLAETNEIVDQINDNEQEVELLEELGLDAEGTQIPEVVEPGLAVPPELAGYRFTWADPSGQDLDVTLDLATGDFAVAASDGISFRRIGEAFYGQDGSDGEWFQLATDPFGEIPVVGLDGLPAESAVVPASAAPYIASDSIESGTRVVMIDDAAFAAAELDARNDWLAPWGLLNDDGALASNAIVQLTFDASGEHVISAHIETPAIGGFASFTVVEAFDTAPAITNPLAD